MSALWQPLLNELVIVRRSEQFLGAFKEVRVVVAPPECSIALHHLDSLIQI